MITMFNLNQLKQKVLFGTFSRNLAKKEKSRACGARAVNAVSPLIGTVAEVKTKQRHLKDGETKEILS